MQASLAWFDEQGIKPTLRTMYYRLVSLGVLPNTGQAYKSLSKQTVKARKEQRIRRDAFADQGRVVITDGIFDYITPGEYVDRIIAALKNAPFNYQVPRWHGQPYYVEVWIEKQALADTFQNFLRDRQVRIAVNRGYSGYSFLFENCRRVAGELRQGKRVRILYFGDLDPSGEDMDRYLQETFQELGVDSSIYDFSFQRIGVTIEQIRTFDLPSSPDSETTKKLRRDSRAKRFIAKYGSLFAVELDALLAYRPVEFRALVQEAVDSLFNFDTNAVIREEHSAEAIWRLVSERVTFKEDSDETRQTS